MLLLSLVIPTYNESKNIPILLERLNQCLSGVEKEVIIVDDNSPDKTWEISRNLTKVYPWLRVIRRIDERGLSSAVLKGFELSEGKILAVMDADLQHDEQALMAFLNEFQNGAEIVVGSRKALGGNVEDWSTKRKFVSFVATVMAKLVLPNSVSDPMSGFFALKREIYQKNKFSINPRGFKILLEFLARSRNANIKEVGYTFRGRVHGESKLSQKIIFEYIQTLYELSLGKLIPIRFIKYSFVGLIGLIIGTIAIWLCKNLTQLTETETILVSIEISIIVNFLLNNYWTFRMERLIGFWKFSRGIITFHAICLGGAFINHAIAIKLLSFGNNVYFANFIGYFIAAIWNYIINVNITWRRHEK